MEQPMIFKLKASLQSNGVTLLNAAEVDSSIESATPPNLAEKRDSGRLKRCSQALQQAASSILFSFSPKE
jgi:hypothetical protein